MQQQTRMEEFRSFGDWLRRRRRALDLTQATLAKRASCSAATIRKIEADERKPSRELAELLATALDVPDEARVAFVQAARHVRVAPPLFFTRQTSAPTTPLRDSPHDRSHNLPAPMTSHVDRVRDAANVAGLLARADVRLLTLLGPPGIGKTRLAVHTAEQIAAHFRDGVWFVDLALLTKAALVLPTIGQLFAIADAGETTVLERLLAFLAERRLLLVLDNFEQVSEAATEVGALLRGCKGLKVLATSRTPLRLAGEHEYALSPLSLPQQDGRVTLDPIQLMAYESVQLFVARLRQHQHDFAVTAANADEITTICLQLDGMPLALELAAAAARTMPLSQLAATLNDETNRLHVLHSPAVDLPPRQRTLYHAIAWSYHLLEAAQQSIFRQLGVFVGGFTAAAAQAVCGANQAALARLTEQSLLAPAPGRWQMLEMIRDFALAQMDDEEKSAALERHAAYFVSLPVDDFDEINRDHANFRAALVWAISVQDSRSALTLCVNLCWFWETRGYLRDGLALARVVLAMPDSAGVDAADLDLRIYALERVSTLAWLGHDFETALQLAEKAVVLARRSQRPAKQAKALNILGRILLEQGDFDAAEVALEECVQLAHQATHLYNPGCPLTQLSEVALSRGDWDAAQAHLAQAIPWLARTPEGLYMGVHIALAYTNLAEVALAQNDSAQARYALQQALTHARPTVRRLRCLLISLAGTLLQSLPATPQSDVVAVSKVLGAVAGMGERSGGTLSPFYQSLSVQRTAYAQQFLTQTEWKTAWNLGHSWTQAQAIAEAERWLASGSLA